MIDKYMYCVVKLHMHMDVALLLSDDSDLAVRVN